jgi:hypothetical protein
LFRLAFALLLFTFTLLLFTFTLLLFTFTLLLTLLFILVTALGWSVLPAPTAAEDHPARSRSPGAHPTHITHVAMPERATSTGDGCCQFGRCGLRATR